MAKYLRKFAVVSAILVLLVVGINNANASSPTVSLTSPTNNSTYTVPSGVTLTASASEVGGTITRVDYYANNGAIYLGEATTSPYTYVWNTSEAGTFSLTAQATDANGIQTMSAPVDITVNPHTPPTVSLTAPSNGTTYVAPANIVLTSNPYVSGGSIVNVNYYYGSEYIGAATSSPYSVTWSNVEAGSYVLTAVAYDSTGLSTTSSPVDVTVNPPPSVSITSPSNNASYTFPASVVINASASNFSGTITQVAFYNGTTLLGTTATSPYTYTWSDVAAGTYSLTAVATDSTGARATSPAISVTVIPAPTVSLTSPTSNSTYTVPSGVTLTASASEVGGTITRVDYYANNGAIYLGEATTSPYTYVWNTSEAGTFSLTAKATDANGIQTMSAPVDITVDPHTPPTVSLTAPANGATYIAPANIVLTSNPYVSGGSIVNVNYYYGSEYIGAATSSPYSVTWSGVTPGTYVLTAVAYDSTGLSTTSSAVDVTVATPSPVVAITSPANGSNFTTGSTVTITAAASETNGSISKVSFYYNGTNLLGSSTASPYSVTVNNVPAGNYVLTAVATDANGVTTTSSPVTVIVSSSVIPTITTQPVNVTVTEPAPATFTIVATGTPAPTYQWVQVIPGRGVILENIPGATNASYTTGSTLTSMSGSQYECVVTNASGSVTSNVVVMTVNAQAFLPVVSITSPANNSTLTAGSNLTITASASETNGTISSVAFYNGAILLGTSTTSPYSYTATNLSQGTYSLTAIATDAGGVQTTSAPVTVTVLNAPPVVTITSPANNSTITAGSNMTITASASEPYGTISSVAFYNGTTLLGTSTTSPYSYTAANLSAGTYTLTATATDTNGVSTTSSPVTVLISGLPVVTITDPASNSTLATGSNMTITASASEINGTINSVSFYNGTVLLGTSTTSPYSYTVTNLSLGTYTLTATATDANGASTTSSPVAVTVSNIPIVAITSPAGNSTLAAGSNMTITASASENNGTISSVSFYNGETLLGTSTTSPYSYTATNLSVGIYTLTATAKDANGVSTTSSPVTINVQGTPVVSIVSPVNNNALTTGSLDITAIATESNNGGSISNVAFYNGTTLLGTVTGTSQAFTYSWTIIPAGTYSLTAVATDPAGGQTTSTPVIVTINAANFTLAVDDNVATKTDARGNTTSYQYDNDNRLLQTTFADSSTVSYAYDVFGNQISVTDQRGNTLTKTYDAYERLSQTKDPFGGITQFNYDTNGDLLTLTDANGNNTTYTYDSDYRVLTQTNALNFTTAFTYDPDGNVSIRTDANGNATSYTYDALNRLTNTTYPDSTSVANVYDVLGRKTSMTDATGSTTYTYDALSQLLKKVSPGSLAITYGYDSEGNRATTVDQSGRAISNTYDALNRLSSVTAPPSLNAYGPSTTSTYGYDANSNKILVTSPNGVTESYTYDALNRVLTDVNAKGSTVITSYANVYDIAGMITKKTFQDGSWTAYSYDALNRLLEETNQTSSSIVYDYVYTYDLVGNRLTWTKNTTLGGFWATDYLNMPSQVLTNMTSANYGNTANPTQAVALARSYSYDAANRLTGWNYAANIYSASFPIQADSYTYDNNGNRLTKQAVLTGQESTPQQTSYAYDFENRLNQLNYVNIPNITGTQTDSLTYNGEGLRTQSVLNSVTANYLYDGSNVSLEMNSSNDVTKTYTRTVGSPGGIGGLIGQNYSSGSTVVSQYYQYNDLGSVSNLTSSTGTTAENYNYDAFGNLLTPQASTDTNRYLFSTKEFDSRSGLDYFGSRYYDPEIGRWLTPDPLGFINGPNSYLYCLNNPVNFVDPYGLEIERQIYGANFDPLAAIEGLELGMSPAELLFGLSNPFANINLNQYAPNTSQTIGYGATALVLGGFGTALAVPATEAAILPIVGTIGTVGTANTVAQQLAGGNTTGAKVTGAIAGIAELAGNGASLINPALKEPVSSAVGSVLDTIAKAYGYSTGNSALTQ